MNASVDTSRLLNASQNFFKKAQVLRKSTLMAAHISLGVCIALTIGLWVTNRFTFQRKICQWWLRRTCKVLNLNIKINGSQPETGLIVSNHISWVDIIVIGGHLSTRFLSKTEVRQWPIIGWLSKCAGTLYIKRGDGKTKHIINDIAGELSRNESILVFPEATSTDGQQVKRFFPHMFDAAIKAGAVIQPIAIQYRQNGQRSVIVPFVGDDEFFPHLRQMLGSNDIDVDVTILDVIPVTGESNQNITRKGLSKMAHKEITSSLNLPPLP